MYFNAKSAKICLTFILIFSLKTILLSSTPNPVTDLKVVEVKYKQVKLSWTVPTSTEPVSAYQIRVSSFLALTTENEWNKNSSVTTPPYRIRITTSGVTDGEKVYYTVTGLQNGVGYFFAVKSSTYVANLDETTAWSGIQEGGTVSERYALPQNSTPQQFYATWPVESIIVTSQTITFNWEDVQDNDINYGDVIKYEFYISTVPSLIETTPPNLAGAQVFPNITTSYFELSLAGLTDNITYYWRVKAFDSENTFVWMWGEIYGSGKNPRFILNYIPEAPSLVTLYAPDKSTTTTTPVYFDWNDVFDPDPQDVITYWLYISSQSEKVGFSLSVGGITWSSYTLSSVFGGWVENATYWWHVVAKDTSGLESRSSTWWFIVNNENDFPIPNTLLSPGTTIYDPIQIVFTTRPTFYWTSSYDPDPYSYVKYQLYISSYSDSPSDLNSLIQTSGINTTYYYLSDNEKLQDDTTYFWRVRIWDKDNNNVWSSTVAWFYVCSNLDPADLLLPLDGITTSYLRPAFIWQPKFIGYEINFASQTLIYWTGGNTTTISGLSPYTTYYTPDLPLKNNATYYWKVVAHSNSTNIPLTSTSSVVFKFYTRNLPPSTFDIITPSGTVIMSTFTVLNWQTAQEPESEKLTYTVFYSTNNFVLTYSSSNIENISFTLHHLQDNTTYWWCVSAVDVWGNTTFSNSTFYFVVNNVLQQPTTFNLFSPSNNNLLTNTYTTFYWQPSFDPDPFESIVYRLVISTDIEFKHINFATTTTDTKFFLPKGFLKQNYTYYWIVIASSTGSGFTFANSTFSFTVINTAPTGLNVISPENFELVISSPVEIRWSPATDPQEDEFWYKLYYTTSVINNIWISSRTVVLSSTVYSYVIDDVVDDTTYYWYIEAIDVYNNVTTKGEYVFWTCYNNQPPTVPQISKPANDEKIELPYNIKWHISTDNDIFDKVKYTLHLSTSSDFITFLTIASSITVTEFKFYNFELIPSKYYLKVIAEDKYGGTNISTVSFYIDRYHISIISPQNGVIIKSLPIKFNFSKVVAKYAGDIISYKLVYSSVTNFEQKIDFNLQENFYEITQPPIYPATYYWYVEVYYNNSYAGKSDLFSFVIPEVLPSAPTNLRVLNQPYGVVLTWDSVEIENIWGYKIYSGYELTSLNLIAFTTQTVYTDVYGLGKNLFYMVSCINQFGKESVNNLVVRLYFNETADIFISSDSLVVLTIPSKERLTNVKILRLPQEDDGVIYTYEILADKNKLNNFVEIRFMKPTVEDGSYIVEYYDGYNWRVFPSEDFGNSIVVRTQYLGRYRVVRFTGQSLDEITIIGCSPNKRIITPNNDGKNDYIEFHYKVGSYIDGEIYDINLQRICKLKKIANNILYFDAKDENGRYLPPGLYIYSIKSTDKTFNGTIVIKY